MNQKEFDKRQDKIFNHLETIASKLSTIESQPHVDLADMSESQIFIELEEELKSQKSIIKKLTKSLEEAAKIITEQEGIKQDSNKIESQYLEIHQQEIEQLNDKVNNLAVELTEKEQVNKELLEANSSLTKKLNEVLSLKKDLQVSLKQHQTNADQALKEKQEELSHIKKQNEEFSAKLSELENKTAKMLADHSKLNRQIVQAQAQSNKLEKENKAYLIGIRAKLVQIEYLEQELEKAKKKKSLFG